MARRDRDYQSIGEVLVALKPEFPDVSISKIRFLETEGLIDPERTASGYRKFYDADVQRLRTILKLQRDEYLPLRVIKQRLDGQAGPGETEGSAAPGPAPAEPDEERVERTPNVRMNADEIAAAAGVDREVVEDLTSFGVLRPETIGGVGSYNGEDLQVLRMVSEFVKYGVEARHLRMYRHFADREAAFFEQIILPMLRQRNPDARKMADEALAELTRSSRKLKDALLKGTLRRSLPG
ncbi:MAG TPA: MerR family transcriptional regulator [Actinomycetota bacterium]|nr:MerR family transcriptional regulator [Actinomycetota bacterium]